jgi:hypothetical protein
LRQTALPKSAGVAGLLAMTVPRYFSDRLLLGAKRPFANLPISVECK